MPRRLPAHFWVSYLFEDVACFCFCVVIFPPTPPSVEHGFSKLPHKTFPPLPSIPCLNSRQSPPCSPHPSTELSALTLCLECVLFFFFFFCFFFLFPLFAILLFSPHLGWFLCFNVFSYPPFFFGTFCPPGLDGNVYLLFSSNLFFCGVNFFFLFFLFFFFFVFHCIDTYPLFPMLFSLLPGTF